MLFRSIEVYDNSHIQGTNAVGCMIVAGPEGFAKAHYRKFNMKATDGDDYAMMREMLTRRLKRIVSGSVSDAQPVPDLRSGTVDAAHDQRAELRCNVRAPQ